MIQRFKRALAYVALIQLSLTCRADEQRSAGLPESKVSRPNILFIVSEDNSEHLGCYGEQRVHTPHLDSLAAGGVRYTRAYVPYSVCSPSRAAFLTGLYTRQTGHIGLATHRFSMYRDFKTIPAYFQQAGYYTGFLGKTHVNPQELVEDFVDHRAIRSSNFGKTTSIQTYADEARAVMQKAAEQDKPFLLIINYADAHRKFVAKSKHGFPSKLVENPIKPFPWIGSDTPYLRLELRDYFNCMNRLDEGVGMVLRHLDEMMVRDNTLVIYISDHGADFPRGKGSIYENGTRVPMIVNHAKGFPAAKVEDALVSTIDILPTMLRAAGLAIPKQLPGFALQDVDSGKVLPRKYIHTFTTGSSPNLLYVQFGIRDQRYKLVYNPDRALNRLAESRYRNSNLPQDQQVQSLLYPSEYELFDLQEDPHEWKNLADSKEHTKIREQLLRAMKEFQREMKDPFASDDNIRTFIAEQKKFQKKPYKVPGFRWPHLAMFRRAQEAGKETPRRLGAATSFEASVPGEFAQLKTPIGTWIPQAGKAIVDNKHASTGRQCLQLTGGEKTSVVLQLADDVEVSDHADLHQRSASVLTFRAERWTKRLPFSFRIDRQTDSGWQEIFNGDDQAVVGRGFRSRMVVPLNDKNIRQLRFTVSSPPNTGLLIDDLQIGPPSDSDAPLDRRIVYRQRSIPKGVPLEGHAKDAKMYGYRIPSLLVTERGSILAFTERRLGLHDHAQNDIVLRRSTDSGRSWGDEIVVYEDGMNSINDPLTVQLANGRILLMFARFPYGRHTLDSGWIKMAELGYDDPTVNVLTFVCHSDDDRRTWSKPVDISRQVKHPSLLNANTPGAMIQLTKGPHKGRVVTGLWGTLPTTTNGDGSNVGAGPRAGRSRQWRIVVAYSDDNGETWKRTALLEDESGLGFPNECQVAEAANGELVLVSRNQGGQRFRKKAISRDGGETWTAIVIDKGMPSVACMGSLIKGPVKKDGTWDLWASFPSNTGRKDGQIAVSTDNGRTWRIAKIIPGPFAYSALQVSPDQKHLLCLYESEGYRTETLLTIPFDTLE